MRNYNHGSIRQQINILRQFLQEGDRLFADVLPDETLSPALEVIGTWKDRIYTHWQVALLS